jgi:hypothetical protein
MVELDCCAAWPFFGELLSCQDQIQVFLRGWRGCTLGDFPIVTLIVHCCFEDGLVEDEFLVDLARHVSVELCCAAFGC